MQQVKIFKSIESELNALEDEINEWIAESKAKVINITGNIAAQSTSSGSLGDSFSGSDVLCLSFTKNRQLVLLASSGPRLFARVTPFIMKIDRLEFYLVAMPLLYPWRTAYGEDPAIHAVLCRMCSGSVDAWGETSPLAAPCYSSEWGAASSRWRKTGWGQRSSGKRSILRTNSSNL